MQIATSIDGKAFANVKTGTWADTADNKTEAFAATTAKYVRLTCTTEAGGRVRMHVLHVLSAAQMLYGHVAQRLTAWCQGPDACRSLFKFDLDRH